MNTSYSFEDQEDDLEQSLAAELHLEMPSPGFADAVMRRIAREKQQQSQSARRQTLRWHTSSRWLALAAVLFLLLLPATYTVRSIHQRRQAELMQARFDLAMRLTSRTLARVDATIDGTLNRAAATPRNASSN